MEKLKEDKTKGKKKPKKNTLKEKQTRQLLWAIILMVSIILIVIFVPLIKKNYLDKFEYIGLDFQKTQAGEVMFYSTRIPIANQKGEVTGSYAINFREDPRELESIKVDIPDGVVTFLRDKMMYISIQSDIPICGDNVIAVAGLTDFLKSFGALQVKGAIDNESHANETGFPYVTCENTLANTVIMVRNGNETIIKKSGENCYEIEFKGCEINKATEKFSLIVLERYMSYFGKR